MQPLASPDPVSRTLYRAGRVLRAADLIAEQNARGAAFDAHQASHHTPGVVAGLVLDGVGTGCSVGPGMAIDAAGRTLAVAASIPVTAELLTEAAAVAYPEGGGQSLDVWLRADDCGDADTAVVTFAREKAHDPLTPGDAGVFLGTIKWYRYLVAVDMGRRVYVGAVGHYVHGTSGVCRVQYGPHDAGDPRRYAVALRPAPAKDFADVLSVDADERIRLLARTTVEARDTTGDKGPETGPPGRGVVVVGERDRSCADPDAPFGLVFHNPGPEPAAARPAAIYLVSAGKDRLTTQLRFEIPHPGKEGDPARHCFCVGVNTPLGDVIASDPFLGVTGGVALAGQKAVDWKTVFEPVLSVTADKRVVLHGTGKDEVVLTIPMAAGALIQTLAEGDPNDPRVKAQQLGLVRSSDLVLLDLKHESNEPKLHTFSAKMWNLGQATVTGLQVHGSLFNLDDATKSPLPIPLARGVDLPPGSMKVEATVMVDGIPDKARVRLDVSAAGIGPAGQLLEMTPVVRVFDWPGKIPAG